MTTEISEKAITDLYDVFSVIDTYYFDNGNEWIAGESITVADFAYVATISTLLVLFHKTKKNSTANQSNDLLFTLLLCFRQWAPHSINIHGYQHGLNVAS